MFFVFPQSNVVQEIKCNEDFGLGFVIPEIDLHERRHLFSYLIHSLGSAVQILLILCNSNRDSRRQLFTNKTK